MVAVHLNKQIDDIFSGYSKLETPEERMEHKVEGSLFFEGYEELMKQYEKLLTRSPWDYVLNACSRITAILTPQQINSFLQATMIYENHNNFSANTGFLITRLIQNSHDAGNNKFTLNTGGLKEIDCISYGLKGKENKLLEIIVAGNARHHCGNGAENIQELYISGDIGYCCAWEAKNIKEIYIVGNSGLYCGYDAENSTFKTQNKQTLQLLKKNVLQGKNNRIYFIHPDKQEEEIIW
ncbi:MAG: hypothetical protein ABIB71_06920 [Candidatus Woesearchaeota archaeon]